jgi:hypothetical protein
MDITSIYKKDKLYKVDPSLTKGQRNEVKIPLNFNNVAILYEYQDSDQLPTEMETFLNKVIEGGMKLNSSETLKANLYHTDITMQRLSEQIGAKKVVVFGTDWMDSLKNGHLEKNLICMLFGMKVLVTDALDEMNTNDNAKKIFWGHLKKMF